MVATVTSSTATRTVTADPTHAALDGGGTLRHSMSSSSNPNPPNPRTLTFLDELWSDWLGGTTTAAAPPPSGSGAGRDAVNWEEWLGALLNDGGFEELLTGLNAGPGQPGEGDGSFAGVLALLGTVDWSTADVEGVLDTLGGDGDGNLDWSALLETVAGGGSGGGLGAVLNTGREVDLCSILELARGMSPQFDLRANCHCRGDFLSGWELDCSFPHCAAAPTTMKSWDTTTREKANDDDRGGACGTVQLAFNLGGPTGIMKATACADFTQDAWEESCFSYEMDMRTTMDAAGSSATTSRASCDASYGGNSCACTIDDNLCLSIDCRPYLEGGGTMDTCQILSMINAEDVTNWFPNFDAFLPGFDTDTDNSINIGGVLDGLSGRLPGNNGNGNDKGDESDDQDSSDDNEVDEESGDANVPVDLTSPSSNTRPFEPINDGDIMILQASELVNSGSSSTQSTTTTVATVTGTFVSLVVVALVL